MRILLTSIVVILCGCGSSGPTDPLTGTWSESTCYGKTGLPDNVESCTTTLTFTAALTFTLVATEQAPPASAVAPRCLTTHTVTGLTWSEGIKDNTQTLTLAGSPKSVVSVSGCVHDSDNQGEKADPDTVVTPGDMPYNISGKTVNISSGSLAGAYTRN